MPLYETVKDAGSVDYERWAYRGVKAVIFDKDGTLTHANQLLLVDDVIERLRGQRLGELFSRIAVVSNNHDPIAVQEFAIDLTAALNLDTEVLAVSRTKYDGYHQKVVEAYRRKPYPEMGEVVAKQIGITTREFGVVGDRRATDVRFGLNLGARAIALTEKAGEGDAPYVQLIRPIEKVWVETERLMGRAA